MRNMKATIFEVSSHSTIVLLGADRQLRRIWIFYLQGIFIHVFYLNIPSVSFQLQPRRNVSIYIYRRNSPIEEVHSSERTGTDFSAV